MKRSKPTLFDFAFTKNKHISEQSQDVTDVTPGTVESVLQREESVDNFNEIATTSTRELSVAAASTSAIEIDSQPSKEDEVPTKKKKQTSFQNEWRLKWPWAEDSKDGIKCILCLKHRKENSMTKSGCFNYKTTTLQRHAESSSHKEALHSEVLQKDYVLATEAAKAKQIQVQSTGKASILAAMRTGMWMAKEDIAIQKYSSLIDFQKLQGCEDIINLQKAGNATYQSVESGKEFQKIVGEALHLDLVEQLKAHKYSILIDESTDIAISKHLVIYIRFMSGNFDPKTFFFKNVTITDPKSSAEVIFNRLMEALAEDGIDISKCVGFGSDGAAVMVGKEKGVAALVKRESPHCVSVHCMAHRLNLATSLASKDIDYIKSVENTLSDIFYYFGGSKSGNRKCELQEMQTILDDPKLKIKECHQIRWLAFLEAVNTVLQCWLSLRELFCKKSDSKAVSFYNKFREYKFLAVLHMLMDILPSLSQFSLQLQKRDLDIASVVPALRSVEADIKKAKEGSAYYQTKLKDTLVVDRDDDGKVTELKYKEKTLDYGDDLEKVSREIHEITTQFCDTLIDNLGKRFPKESKELTSAFGVLAMTKLQTLSEEERSHFGDKEINQLIDFFGEAVINKTSKKTSNRLIDPVACRAEWQTAKQLVWDNKYVNTSTRVLYKQLHQYHKDALPNLLLLAELALILPLHTPDCERGFSAQNAIITSKRNRLGEESLNTLMTLKCEGSLQDENLLEKSFSLWIERRQRRMFQKK